MDIKPLEPLRERGTVPERLIEAAARIAETVRTETEEILRPEQGGVYADFAEYLTDVATRPDNEPGDPPMARLILPPRIGKTVIACRIAKGAGLMTTFIVPTKTLVEQAAEEFRRFLPDAPVGTFCGEAKDLVVGGVNVTTYQILQRCMRTDGELPWQIACSALVFADEGHRAMTRDRLHMLRHGFDPRAVRLALTATPDYDEERSLARFFPELIHEMTVQEAMELNLLAPVRFWLAEVDEDASSVDIVAGDLHNEQLGRLMSAAPFFEAARHYRYDAKNRERAALICCASRRQAYDLLAYLRANRPEGAPIPRVIVGETPGDERRKALADFEGGAIDTLINVGVLLEGWNSPRCKLLIDLSPSLSPVRAMQKFFRPLTRWERREAHIYMFVPKNLSREPIMPLDIFAAPSGEYEAGELISAPRACGDGAAPKPISSRKRTPIEKVELVSRIALTARFERPKLDRKRDDQIRAVLESQPEFRPEDDVGGVQRFRWLQFRHPLFSGRGLQLLRFLGVQPSREGHIAFMARLYPEGAARRYIAMHCGEHPVEDACSADATYLMAKLVEAPDRGRNKAYGFPEGWRAVAGSAAGEPEPSMEDILERRMIFRTVFEKILPKYGERERVAISSLCGLPGAPESIKEAADLFCISRSRMDQILKRLLREIRVSLHLRPLSGWSGPYVADA